MPFGAALDGMGARFRLWAPTAERVELMLQSEIGRETLLMNAVDAGWFEVRVGHARAGDRYRFRIDGGTEVPDPASRHQPEDVHGPSALVDPESYRWRDDAWHGVPWHEVVLYELHIGTFTREGTFAAARERLPYLRDLGITAVELMPIADFPGARNWGYDGVLAFAPDGVYGHPDDLKRFIDAAHGVGLAVFLDVVYNHFGPEGNYLHVYARDFFTARHETPWGTAINFDGTGSRTVRDFYVHNALYWLEEYHFDGLRLDAVHAICDESPTHILTEIAEVVRRGPGRGRCVHLVLENDDNAASFLERAQNGARGYDAQWNDDAHHALHVLVTGETDGYYSDYADAPVRHLARTLAEGYAYQGERSHYRGRPHGEISRHLPATAFIDFLQNHDQVGNRAFGDRISTLASAEALRAAYALLLLAPAVPLLFMSEEFGCTQPFPFFCDFGGELGQAVTAGRRREFAAFARFSAPRATEAIPDPNASSTFESAVIDWDALRAPQHAAWHARFTHLLAMRRKAIVPLLPRLVPGSGRYTLPGSRALRVEWHLVEGARLVVLANLGDAVVKANPEAVGELIYAGPDRPIFSSRIEDLAPWSVTWFLDRGTGA